jgi:hypothetical protein
MLYRLAIVLLGFVLIESHDYSSHAYLLEVDGESRTEENLTLVSEIPLSYRFESGGTRLSILRADDKGSYRFVPFLTPYGQPIFDGNTGKLSLQILPFLPPKFSNISQETLNQEKFTIARFGSVTVKIPSLQYSFRYSGQSFPALIPGKAFTLDLSIKKQFDVKSRERSEDFGTFSQSITRQLALGELRVELFFENRDPPSEKIKMLGRTDFLEGLHAAKARRPHTGEGVYSFSEIYRRWIQLVGEQKSQEQNQAEFLFSRRVEFSVASVTEILDAWFAPLAGELYRIKQVRDDEQSIAFLKASFGEFTPVVKVELIYGSGSPLRLRDILELTRWRQSAILDLPIQCDSASNDPIPVKAGQKISTLSILEDVPILVPLLEDSGQMVLLDRPHIVLQEGPKLLMQHKDCAKFGKANIRLAVEE